MKKFLRPLILALLPFLLISCKNEGINGEKSDLIVTDSCGNTYTTMKITVKDSTGADKTIIWMAENFRADKDALGNAIEDSLIYNPNKDEANVAKYGKLYCWEAAQKMCPEGWRLPTKDEAKALINAMGDADIAAAKLSGEKDLWKNLSMDDKDLEKYFGKGLFNAIPAGYMYHKEYYGFQYNANFWTSSLDDSDDAKKLEDPQKKVYSIIVDPKGAQVGAVDRNFALSIRCVKE